MMKFTIPTAIVAGLIVTPAFAADMGVPPAPPPAPVYNWTGWYAGVNAGASMGSVKTDFNIAPVHGVIVGGVNDSGRFSIPGFAGSDTVYPDGFIGGGQIGYNWQFSPVWVVGLEADFQGAAEKDSATLINSFTVPIGFPVLALIAPAPTVSATGVINYATKIEWFGTARLRAGYVWGNANVFSYVTGGLAYGNVDIEGTNTVSGIVPDSTPFSITHSFGHSNVNTGWTLGYGTEGRLATPGWTWKVESLYMDFGHLNDPDEEVSSNNASGGQIHTHTHFTDWILRGGLNYQFH